MKCRIISLTGAALAMTVLILDSKNSIRSAAGGVDLCIRTVIPSLFPFFLVSAWINSMDLQSRILRIPAILFRIPEDCQGILISGFLGGYPTGAQAVAQLTESGRLEKDKAGRMLSVFSQAGPSFLFGIAAGAFPSAAYGWGLWAVQILSALTLAQFLPKMHSSPQGPLAPSPITLPQAMKKAIAAISSACGWVLIFRVTLDLLNRMILFRLPPTVQVVVWGMLELTNGCTELGMITNTQLRFLGAALMLNLGGICVAMQTASVTNGLPLRHYLTGKLTQAVFALIYAALFLIRPWLLIFPVSIMVLRSFPGKIRKNSSNPPSGVVYLG